jgi:trigger factor
MNLQVENLESHEVRLTIGVEQDAVEKARRDVARELSKQVRIPGFRPGHAPIAAVIRAMGGEEAFAAEVANKIASDWYPKALDQAKIEPYGPGSIEDVKSDPFALIARVPLDPVIDLKDYQSIRLPVPEIVVTDEEIKDQLDHIREENAVVTLAERPAEMGDLIEATIVGMSGGEEVFRSQARRGIVLDAKRIGIPGLAEAIVGVSAGEHKDAQITIAEDHESEALRGKTIDVHIDVTRVSSRMVPELSDELAQAASSFSTLAEMTEDVRKQTAAYKQRVADQDYAVSALDAFAALAEIKVPPAFVEDRLNDLLADYKEDIRRDSGMPFEEWLKLQGKTEEQVREELRPDAERRGKRGLVMRELGRLENIDVADDEIAAEVENTALRYGSRQSEVRKLLANQDTRSSVRNNILSNKVMARMVAIAKGDAAAAPAAEA